jgi:ABC-type transporter Mla subunit MlaD
MLDPAVRRLHLGRLGVERVFSVLGVAAIIVLCTAVIVACGGADTNHLTAYMGGNRVVTAGEAVRLDGARVGRVDRVSRFAFGNGQFGSKIDLALDRSVGRLPVDTTMKACGAFGRGSAYLQLIRGRSARMFAEGGPLPASQVLARPVC